MWKSRLVRESSISRVSREKKSHPTSKINILNILRVIVADSEQGMVNDLFAKHDALNRVPCIIEPKSVCPRSFRHCSRYNRSPSVTIRDDSLIFAWLSLSRPKWHLPRLVHVEKNPNVWLVNVFHDLVKVLKRSQQSAWLYQLMLAFFIWDRRDHRIPFVPAASPSVMLHCSFSVQEWSMTGRAIESDPGTAKHSVSWVWHVTDSPFQWGYPVRPRHICPQCPILRHPRLPHGPSPTNPLANYWIIFVVRGVLLAADSAFWNITDDFVTDAWSDYRRCRWIFNLNI